MSAFFAAVVNLFVLAVPAHLLAYYPFRDRLRVPLWRALIVVCLFQTVHSLLYGYAVWLDGSGRAVMYGYSAVYMVIYFFYIRDDRFKLLFLYLFVMDYEMILWGISVYIEAHFFYAPGMNFASWTSVALNLIVLVVSAPFIIPFFSTAKNKVFDMDAPVFWRTAWMIPASTTAIVMIFTGRFTAESVRSFGFLFARVLLVLCVFVVYSILLDALDGIRRQAALREQAAMQEQLLDMQRMQQGQILKHMEEIKAARHDLRQHLGVMKAYLEQDDIDGLKAYLRAYEQRLPADACGIFTKNFALNSVCAYYAEEARKYEIKYDVKLEISEDLPVSEPEMCAVLGNLLKNAVDACREASSSAPFIRVRGISESNHIVITVDNSCEREPVWEDGSLRSTKHEGLGTGTRIIRETAERSGGAVEFTYKDGVFFASVFLYG